MQTNVTLSSWSVDISCDPIRIPTRPTTLRYPDFEDSFDFTTVFCDIFRDVNCGEIVLLGPPLLNLKTDLDLEFKALPSGEICSVVIKQKRWLDQINVAAPKDTTGLLVLSQAGRVFIAPQPNLSDLFSGKRVIFTLNKNNDIRWIQDWVQFYCHCHGCNAVLIYDNSSDAYAIPQIEEAVRSVSENIELLVVPWPFTYGVFDGRYDLTYSLWDSFYCQALVLEHARRRFLCKAKSVLNVDIDEFVLSETSGSVFETVEQSKTGFVCFDGWWVYSDSSGEKALQKNPLLHRDCFYRKKEYPDASTEKWAVIPSRVPDERQWMVHDIRYMPRAAESAHIRLRHFKEINTSWNIDGSLRNEKRSESFKGDSHDLEIDQQLLDKLQEVFSDHSSEPRKMGKLRSERMSAYHMRVLSGHLVARGEADQAIEAAGKACDLSPEHPGLSLHLASLLRQKGMDREALKIEKEAYEIRKRDPQYYIQLARRAASSGESERAICELNKAIAINRRDIEAHYLLFKEFVSHHAGGDARLTAEKWISESHTRSDAFFLAATMCEYLGRIDEAITFIQEAINIEPKPAYFHLHAALLMYMGEFSNAEKSEREAITLETTQLRLQYPVPDAILLCPIPESELSLTDAYQQLASILEYRGKYDEAVKALEKAIELNWALPEVLFNLARLYNKKGETVLARRKHEDGVRLSLQLPSHRPDTIRPVYVMERDYKDLCVRISNLLVREGFTDSGLEVMRSAVRFSSLKLQPTLHLIELCLETGRVREAEQKVRELLSLNPSHCIPKLLYLHSRVFEALGELSGAVNTIRSAITMDSRESTFHHHLGNLLARMGDPEGAEKAQKFALELRPWHRFAQRQWSIALEQFGRLEEALEAAQKAVTINPGDAAGHHHLGNLFSRLEHWKEAVDSQQRVLELCPGHKYACRQLSIALEHLDLLDESLKMALKSVEVNPGDDAGHHHLGNLLGRFKDWEGAVKAQRTALKLNPGHRNARMQLSIALERLGGQEETRKYKVNPGEVK